MLGVQLGQALAQHLDPERGAGPMVVDGGALLAEDAGGSLDVASAPGEGTTVRLEVPS